MFQKKLVLTSSATAIETIDFSDRVNFRRSVNEIVNDFLDLIQRYNLNISFKYNLDELMAANESLSNQDKIMQELVKFIVANVESMIAKQWNRQNVNSISIVTFMLQILIKYFRSDLIRPHYSTLVECLKRTSECFFLFFLFHSLYDHILLKISYLKETFMIQNLILVT